MKNRNFLSSFKNSANGLIHVIKTERNMQFHVGAAFIIIALSFFYRLSGVEFAIICIAVGTVIASELFNTAVEALVDIIVDVYHPKAKIIKDIAAGAVTVSAFAAAAAGVFIFYGRVVGSIEGIIGWIRLIP